jgi:hypothetical protein
MQMSTIRRLPRRAALATVVAAGAFALASTGLVGPAFAQIDNPVPVYSPPILYPSGQTPFGFQTSSPTIAAYQTGTPFQNSFSPNVGMTPNLVITTASTTQTPRPLSPAAQALIAANGGPQVTAVVNTGGTGPVASNNGGGYCNLADGGQVWVPAGADPASMGCSTTPGQPASS